MNHATVVAILISAGLLTGVSWIFVNNACFAAINRWLADRRGNNGTFGVVDLAGTMLAVLISFGYSLIVILAVVWWTNQYPEWKGSSVMFWYGIVGGAVVWRLWRIFWRDRRD